MRNFKITWERLSEILKKSPTNESLMEDEKITRITLKNPKYLLIETESIIKSEEQE